MGIHTHVGAKVGFKCTYSFPGFPGGSDGKESAHSVFIRSLGWEDPWRREWLLTPVYFLGESHGERNLVGYSAWGHKESDMTERLTLSL